MTTTHETPPPAHGSAPTGARPEPIDPEKDIDARTTSIWVIVSAIVLFIALYFMLPLFDRVLQHERARKIDNLVPQDLNTLLEAEDSYLSGDNPSGKSIEQVMKEMAK